MSIKAKKISHEDTKTQRKTVKKFIKFIKLKVYKVKSS
jgi:hypothetical protein